MENIFSVKGLNSDIGFFNPILIAKDTLSFSFSSMNNITGLFEDNKFTIKIHNSNKSYNVKISEEDIKVLNKILKNEKKEAKDYFSKSINGNIELLIFNEWVTTEEIIIHHTFKEYLERLLRNLQMEK